MKKDVKTIVLAAFFLALGLILPFFTGQIQIIGNMLCPMHIPVFLCGLICGWQYGLIIGFVTPILRSLLFGMPVLYPVALAMAAELAAYGAVCGFLYSHSKWQCIKALYRCLILSMIAGRVVWGIAMVILLSMSGGVFTFQAFIAGAMLNAIPGILLQLILIPGIMLALHKTGLVRFKKSDKRKSSLQTV